MTNITGLESGNTIFKKICRSVAPSISAACLSSFGNPLKKVLTNIIFQTPIEPGKIMAHGVSNIPKFLISIYVGINPPLKNIVIRKNIIITFPPINPLIDSGYVFNNVNKIVKNVNQQD